MSRPPHDPDPTASPWWHPNRHSDRRPLLIARGQIKSTIRQWFTTDGFMEVEPGCLQISPGNETHLHGFATELIGTDLKRQPLSLHTSPEFAMKKLITAGETKIFALAPVFRNRERGPLHAPEFTMLEWYRAHAPYTALFDDCAALLRCAADITQRPVWTWRGRDCDVSASCEKLSVADAFARYADISLDRVLNIDATPTANAESRDAFADAAKRIGIVVAPDDTWGDIFSRVMTERIEPNLGVTQPTILHDYPITEAALARPSPTDPRFAERFEMYVCGVELANGFGELTDAATQRTRFEAENDARERIYGDRHPIDEDFLASLALMPPSSGVALGFDRLVMLATGASSVDQVIWTPLGVW